jgi:NAD(P)-dependent dehydrogenase (short-subunit alcohol dehydrogenase family)
MMKDFENKVAAITGAGSGIGQELALELARRGCHLALCCDRNMEGLQETADQARAFGVNVTSQRLDVANRDAVYEWADQVAKDHGKVNLIFNNAGVELVSSVEGIKYEDFEWLMNINFWGVVYGTKAFLPYLKAAGEGHIVNVSSVFGLASMPGHCAYNSAKFAIRGFTDCLREELDIMNCGVSATSVYPGGIKTEITKSGRIDSSIRSLGLDERYFFEKMETAFITEPDKAARGIIRAVEKNKSRALIGPDAYAYDGLVRLLPSSYQPIAVGFVKRLMK